MPIAIVVPMILMAAPDWAGAAFHSITKFAQHKQSAKALKKLKTSPIKVLERTELHHSLTLSDYTAKNRRLPLVSATFQPLASYVYPGRQAVVSHLCFSQLRGLCLLLDLKKWMACVYPMA